MEKKMLDEKKQMKYIQLGILFILTLFLLMFFLSYLELRKDPFQGKTCGEIMQKLSDKKCYLYSYSKEINLSELNLTNQTNNGVFQ